MDDSGGGIYQMPVSEQIVSDNIKPFLEEGEELKHFAYGVKQPHIGLIILMFCLFIVPGAIFVAVATKEYYVALTNRRLLIMRVKNMKRVIEGTLVTYDLNSLPPAKTSTGGLFTHIRIDDPEKPFVAKFHRMGMKTNREHAMAIGEAIAKAY